MVDVVLKLTSKADEDKVCAGREGDGGDGSASARLGGCVCKLVPGVGDEVIGVQGGKSARGWTPCMNVQLALSFN